MTETSKNARAYQALLIVSTVGVAWLGMMIVHELGHVLAAWATGGTVERVVLHPLAISRTDLAYNPRPLLVSIAGPVVGVLVPLAALGAAWLARMPGLYLLRFFTGFCLVANGVYIGTGAFMPVGDADDLLCFGARAWQLAAFGLVTVPAGFALWHGLGKHFGLGEAQGEVSQTAAWVMAAVLAAIVVVEVAAG